jgi:spore maturation protein CgeB
VEFHRGERWTHRWRRTLLEHADELGDILDARFPVFPETKDFSYDAVEVLNAYAMFANDPGLMAFPPARTYEGVACGTLLVGEDTAVHRDLGFAHGENALLHVPHDTEDFARVVREAIAEPEHLAQVAAAGHRMVHERYTHPAVARTLYEQLCRVHAGREP